MIPRVHNTSILDELITDPKVRKHTKYILESHRKKLSLKSKNELVSQAAKKFISMNGWSLPEADIVPEEVEDAISNELVLSLVN